MEVSMAFLRSIGRQRGGKARYAIDVLADEVERLTRERDEARRDLARCYVLSGADTDGNDPESPAGWIHLYDSAVQEVGQLRRDFDDAEDDLVAARKLERQTVMERDTLRTAIRNAERLLGEALFLVGLEPVDPARVATVRKDLAAALDGAEVGDE